MSQFFFPLTSHESVVNCKQIRQNLDREANLSVANVGLCLIFCPQTNKKKYYDVSVILPIRACIADSASQTRCSCHLRHEQRIPNEDQHQPWNDKLSFSNSLNFLFSLTCLFARKAYCTQWELSHRSAVSSSRADKKLKKINNFQKKKKKKKKISTSIRQQIRILPVTHMFGNTSLCNIAE